MPAIGKVRKKDLEAGSKRVNMTLSISEFEDLYLVAEYKKLSFTSLATSIVVKNVRYEAEKIRKSNYVPIVQRGGDLFEGKAKVSKKKTTVKRKKK